MYAFLSARAQLIASEQILRRQTTLLWCIACALVIFMGGSVSAATACQDELAQKVVLLKVTEPKFGGGFEDSRHFTGVVVSDTGLVLTVYDLIGHIKPNDLIGLKPDDLSKRAKIELPYRTLENSDKPVGATVLGYDWRRDILLLKIPALDQIDPRPAVAELSRKSIREVAQACFVSFLETDEDEFTVSVSDSKEVERMARKIGYRGRDLSSSSEQHGGAVLDASDGTLVGMVHAPEGDDTHFLPIEYADTLLSQLFIARITRELDEVVKLTEKMRLGASWNFQIRENRTDRLQKEVEKPEDSPSLKIRFFFSQHVRGDVDEPIRMSKVDLLITLFGIRENDHGNNVPETVYLRLNQDDLKDREPIQISQHGDYFDYDAARQIEASVKQGFSSLESITISINPEFRIDGKGGHIGGKQIFDIKLRPWFRRDLDEDAARSQ